MNSIAALAIASTKQFTKRLSNLSGLSFEMKTFDFEWFNLPELFIRKIF